MLYRTWLVDRRFEGFVSVARFRGSDQDRLPKVQGVYAVLREASDQQPEFIANSVGGHFKDKDPTVSRADLEDSWVKNSRTGNIECRSKESLRFAIFLIGRIPYSIFDIRRS